jgi:hypothetical protein
LFPFMITSKREKEKKDFTEAICETSRKCADLVHVNLEVL